MADENFSWSDFLDILGIDDAINKIKETLSSLEDIDINQYLQEGLAIGSEYLDQGKEILNKYVDDVEESIHNAGTGLKDILVDVGESGKEFGDAMSSGFGNFGQAITDLDSDSAVKALESILDAGVNLADNLDDSLMGATDIVDNVINTIIPGFSEATGISVSDIVGNLNLLDNATLDKIKKTFGDVTNVIGDTITYVKDVKDTFIETGEGFVDVYNDTKNAGQEFFNSSTQGFKNLGQGLLELDAEGVKKAFADIGASGEGLLGSLNSSLGNVGGLVDNLANTIMPGFAEKTGFSFSSVLDDLNLFDNATLNGIKDTLSGVASFATEVVGESSNIMAGFTEAAGGSFEGMAKGTEKAMKGISVGLALAGAVCDKIFEPALEDLGKYDDAIEESYAAQEEALAAFEEERLAKLAEFDEASRMSEEVANAVWNEDKEMKLADMEEELQKSIESGDVLAQATLEKQIAEMTEERGNAAEKDKIAEDRKALEKKLADEKAALEKKTNQDIAMAEYEKAAAEHRNQVATAEAEKNKAIADAGLAVAKAIVQGALGVAASFATGGPVGAGVGLAMVGGIIGAVAGGIGGIEGAAANLDAVKASAPSPPSFAYGTGGYQLPEGGSAIVGERGPEVVSNRSGDLQVESTERTKNNDSGGGGSINIENIIIQVQELTSPEQVIDIMNNLKGRSMSYALQ